MTVKKTAEVIQETCDFCHNEKNHVSESCRYCKKDVCYDCMQNNGTFYKRYVFYCGNELWWCKDCVSLPEVAKTDLYKTCVAIAALKNEYETFYKPFYQQVKSTELSLTNIIENEKYI